MCNTKSSKAGGAENAAEQWNSATVHADFEFLCLTSVWICQLRLEMS